MCYSDYWGYNKWCSIRKTLINNTQSYIDGVKELALLLQGHYEALQASRVQGKSLGQQSLVEGVKGAVMLLERQNRAYPLQMDHLDPP